MPNKVLNITFGAKDGGLISEMKTAGASADALKKKMLELQNASNKGGGDASSGGVLKELKNGLGARSELGQLGKALKGGGAVLGLTLIGSELEKASAKAKELTEQYKSGQISAGGMVTELAKGLPVIGGFVTAGLNIKDTLASFDGLANSGFGKLIGLDDLNYAQKINKELQVTKAVDDYIAGGLEKQKTLLKDIAEEHTKVAQEAGKIGRTGDDLAAYERKVAAENRLTEIQKKRQDALDEADKRHNEATAKVRADKDMSPAQQFEVEQQIQKRANKEKADINNGFNSEVRDANNLSFVEQMQAEKEHGEKLAQLKEDAAKEIGDSQKEAYANHLKELGDNLGAELVMIQKNADDKKAEVLKQLKEQSKGASQADVDTFNKIATDKISGIDADAGEQARLARKAQQEQAVKTLQEGQLDVLRHQADSGDEFAKAQLQRLEAAKANNDEQKKLLDLLKQQLTPQERAAALAELQALKTADHAGVVKQLQDQQQDVLKAQTENGSPAEARAAQKQLEVLELKKKYNEEAAKTAAILQDKNATAGDKQNAIANLKAYSATLGNQYDKALGNDAVSPLKKTASLEERGLLVTGLAASARAKKDPSETVAKNTADAVKLQKEANDAFNQFVQWTQQQQQTNPTIVFGVSDDGTSQPAT